MGGVDERREEAGRLAGYFDVQLLFAEVIAERTSRAFSDACLEFTNLHRRFGLGRIEGGAASPEWARYAAGLERCGSRADRLAWTLAFFVDAPPDTGAGRRFGCFSYELMDQARIVRIHFNNRDSEGDVGPLARDKADRRRAELAEMFRFIRGRHPQARTVWGGSWLYNLEAYRRLFPPDYAASVFVPERVRLDGTSSWGQLLDFRGVVKEPVRAALVENIGSLDVAAPWTAFPLRALGARAEVEGFYRFYGVG
jgi:hypothetical protein